VSSTYMLSSETAAWSASNRAAKFPRRRRASAAPRWDRRGRWPLPGLLCRAGRKTAGHQTDRSWRSDAGLDTARHCPGCRAGDSGAGDDCGRRNSTV